MSQKIQLTNEHCNVNLSKNIEDIHSILTYLSDNCDYAHQNDGIGFNAIDTWIGHNLSILNIEFWDDTIIATAAEILLKYKKQIKRNNSLNYEAVVTIYKSTKDVEKYTSFEIKQKLKKQQKKYGNKVLYLENNLFYFQFDVCFIEDVLHEVKGIPQARYEPELKRWNIPYDSALEVIQVAREHEFIVTKEAYEIIHTQIAKFNETINLSSAEKAKEINITDLSQRDGMKLLPYQVAGISYLLENPRSIVADEMGLGKTLQSIATAQKLNAYPLLIICPSFLKYNWQREINKWIPSLEEKIQVIRNGKSKVNRKSKVTIVNYELISKLHTDLQNIKFKGLICDESHYLKNYKSQRTKSITHLSQYHDSTLRTIMLISGTPFLNRPKELVPQLQIIGKIDVFGGTYKFLKKYCLDDSSSWTSYDGAKNLHELNKKLRQTCFLRREKIDVLQELPEKRRVYIPVSINNKKEYARAANDLILYIGEKAEKDKLFHASSTHLSQEEKLRKIKEYRFSKEYKAAQAEVLVRMTTLRKVTGAGKIKVAKEWIVNYLNSDKKLIVFGVHSEVIEGLITELSQYGIVVATGKQSAEERDTAMQQFQNDDNIKLFLGTIKAAGVGLTLTKASDVLFLEQEWRPGDHEQAEDRAHRIGQKDTVTAWYLIDKETIDDHIYSTIEKKRKLIKEGTGKISNSDYMSIIKSIDKSDKIKELSLVDIDTLFFKVDEKVNEEFYDNSPDITDLSLKKQRNEEKNRLSIDKITELSQDNKCNTEKNRLSVQKHRRSKGIVPREEYLKNNSISRDKPWISQGISRATYYRKKKTTNSCSADDTQT